MLRRMLVGVDLRQGNRLRAADGAQQQQNAKNPGDGGYPI